jgi:hypothetical protein
MPLAPSNLRLADESQPNLFDDSDIEVEPAEEGPTKTADDKGNVIKIEFPDGSVAISLDGSPIEGSGTPAGPKGWFDNLAEDISESIMSGIAEDLLRDIEDDKESRKEWVEDRAQGIKLLGLRIEIPGLGAVADGAPVEGMSKVRHPLLLEACLRFQANARSELLPTDGPVKIREDNNNANLATDQLANDLENDLNHYLTSTATEYYPDTDRMLLMLGFGGSAFKKVYFCPLRNRPVSESIDADDLIVNNSATDLKNAKRVTHRIMMTPSTVKRMQIIGVYKDVDLGQAKEMDLDAVKMEKAQQQGVKPGSMQADNRDREIYECYCELNIPGFEHKRKGKETGLEIPYRVTIDVSSRQILSIVRNYDEKTKDLPEPRETFVKYTFVPGMGFYDIGLLHILGNTTNAITAAWREMLDAGMFSNFPGFLLADTGARQNTNIFRVPPGGGALVKTAGMPINQAVMPLPYKDPSGALMTLVDNMAQTGQRLGGTSETAVGEGKQDAPVGTTLALIDQATKILNSVHKRMHAAQAKEFQLLVDCFRENPESFWQSNRRPARKWDQETFLRGLDQVDLVPQADPNTSSQTQRIMKIVALKQIQGQNPTLFDPIAIDKAALQAIGWSNPEQFMVPPEAQAAPPPQLMQAQAEMAIKKQDADAKTMTANANMIKAKAASKKASSEGLAGGGPDPIAVKKLDLQEKEMNFKQERAIVDDHNRDLDRQANLQESRMRLEGEITGDERAAQHDVLEGERQRRHEASMQDRQHMHEHIQHAQELINQPDPGASKKEGGE